MFRFVIRDMLWLTAVVGLVLVWRAENQARQRSLEVLNRNEVIADRAALAGLWEVFEVTSRGKVQDFRGKPAAHVRFDQAYWLEWPADGRPDSGGEFRMVRPGEFNIDTTGVPGFTAPTKWRYQLRNGELWMIRSKTPGERPIDFDAASDPDLTLYRLRKRELKSKAPAVQVQPADSGKVTEI